MVEVAVIIPVFNNEESIVELASRVISTLSEINYSFKIVFINDCSTDNSLDIISELSEQIPEVEYIHLEQNIGQQQAIRKALKTVNSNYYASMDADLQDPPQDLRQMFERLMKDKCDAVFAQRTNLYQNLFRMLSSRLFKYIVYLMVGLPTRTGGYVLFNRRVKDRLLSMNTKHFYLAGLIAKTKLKICIVESIRNKRTHGKSTYRLWRRWKVAFLCMACLLEKGKKMNQKNQQEANNKIQREYYETRRQEENWRVEPRNTKYISNHIHKFLSFAELNQSERILDVGSGMGKFTLPLVEMGYQMEALDLSPFLLDEMLKLNRTGHDIPIHSVDILNPPAELISQFDSITGFFMLHHLVNIDLAFKKMHLLLKEKGQVAFLDVNPLCALYYFQIFLSPSMRWKAEKGMVNLTKKKIHSGLSSAGFTNVKIERYGILPPILRNTPTGEGFEKLYDTINLLKPFSAFQLIRADKR